MLPRIDRSEVIRQDKDGEWICLKGEEVLQMAGVLMIDEEYVHSEEARDDHEIRNMRNIYGKCKSSRKIDSNLLWSDYNHYSDDAAEALHPTVNPPCMPPASTHTTNCGCSKSLPKCVAGRESLSKCGTAFWASCAAWS
jgi:hypothetical protein